MRGLEAKHYMLLAGFLAALSTELSGMKHGWRDATEPTFLAGLIGHFAVVLGALYAGAPGATGQMTNPQNPDQLPEATGVQGIPPVRYPNRLN